MVLERVGAGTTPALLRMCHTVEAARPWPSPASSPWMRRDPQVGFSAARRSASWRSSTAVDGRPSGRVQCRAMPRPSRAGWLVTPDTLWLPAACDLDAGGSWPDRGGRGSLSQCRRCWRFGVAEWVRQPHYGRGRDTPRRQGPAASGPSPWSWSRSAWRGGCPHLSAVGTLRSASPADSTR